MDIVSKYIHSTGDDLRGRLDGGFALAIMDVVPVLFLAKWIPLTLWKKNSSELFGFVEVVIWFCLGIKWVWDDRHEGHKLMDVTQRENENSWGFDQLVPWFFLVLPLMQFFESYATYCYEDACEKELRERRESEAASSSSSCSLPQGISRAEVRAPTPACPDGTRN